MGRRRILITGLHGTVAPYVKNVAEQQGYQVLPWPRNLVNPDNLEESNLFLSRMNLDAIVHCATGSENWCGALAHFAYVQNIPFVFISSVMVFSDHRNGPYGIFDPADSVENYGLYKKKCEEAVRNNNMRAYIIRLGWQIAELNPGNNMVAFLEKQQRENGFVECSDEWYPACSFIEDSAMVIMKCINEKWCGLFHLDGNYQDRFTYAEIVEKLKKKLNKEWIIKVVENYSHDQRMKDDYLPVIRNSLHFL